MTYAADRLWQEVVYVAYYLHWPLESILDLEHPARHRVIDEIGGIHKEMAGETGPADVGVMAGW